MQHVPDFIVIQYDTQKLVEITPSLAAKLRFYDSKDLNALIKEHNEEKRQILDQNAALLSLLEETESFEEEEVTALRKQNEIVRFFSFLVISGLVRRKKPILVCLFFFGVENDT